jgi:hypothetical protein
MHVIGHQVIAVFSVDMPPEHPFGIAVAAVIVGRYGKSFFRQFFSHCPVSAGMLGHAALLRDRYNVVAFDFRHHGQSSGELTTQGVHERRDIQAVLDEALRSPTFDGWMVWPVAELIGRSHAMRQLTQTLAAIRELQVQIAAEAEEGA